MKPTIGRIVHYNSRNGSTPAIVVNVLANEKIVDLHVFDRDGSTRFVPVVEQGDNLGHWNWPPRV